jgi:hypothetical protein
MSEDRIVRVVDRYGWLIFAVTCVAAGFLVLVDPVEMSISSGSDSSALEIPGWMRPVLMKSAVIACVICVFAMLLGVAAEARRAQMFRESLYGERFGGSDRIRERIEGAGRK